MKSATDVRSFGARATSRAGRGRNAKVEAWHWAPKGRPACVRLRSSRRGPYRLRRRAWNNAVKCSIKNVGTKNVGTNTSGNCAIGAVETVP